MEQPRRAAKCVSYAQFIVERLRRLREARGLTVAELARRSNMDRSHLGKVFRGERGLRADEFLCLCYALGATFEQFMHTPTMQELSELNMRGPDGRPLL